MAKKKRLATLEDIFGETLKQESVVFTEEEIEDGYRRVHIVLPGEPMSKQSVRHSVDRHWPDGSHWCHWCNKETQHKKGDIKTYKNKTTGLVDSITTMYEDSKYDKKKEEYLWMLKSKKCTFKIFEDHVIIEKLKLVFPCLQSFTKTMMSQIEAGIIVYKKTKPDLPDNCKKLLNDTLSGFIWRDDSIIVEERMTQKIYGLNPRIEIILKGK
jgi:Holliday junction resolvase RusA-like endonuclease